MVILMYCCIRIKLSNTYEYFQEFSCLIKFKQIPKKCIYVVMEQSHYTVQPAESVSLHPTDDAALASRLVLQADT